MLPTATIAATLYGPIHGAKTRLALALGVDIRTLRRWDLPTDHADHRDMPKATSDLLHAALSVAKQLQMAKQKPGKGLGERMAEIIKSR